MTIKSVSYSRKGKKSVKNEDACLALPGLGIFAVADGVGGNPNGEVASRSIVDTLLSELQRVELSIDVIDDVIKLANKRVFQKGQGDKGMASTLVLTWHTGDKLYCYSVGDSRVYRIRDGQAYQLTKDHVVQVTRERNRVKNVVNRALGLKADVVPDITEWDWHNSDIVLLVSDGISDRLDDRQIAQLVGNKAVPMTERVRLLVEESERMGGRDDKTVVLVFSLD